MSNENKNPNDTSPSSKRQSGQSQDAERHEKDALHHKFHKGPGRADEKDSQGSRASAQQDSDDMQPSEGQAETPKVGSRDAPGG